MQIMSSLSVPLFFLERCRGDMLSNVMKGPNLYNKEHNICCDYHHVILGSPRPCLSIIIKQGSVKHMVLKACLQSHDMQFPCRGMQIYSLSICVLRSPFGIGSLITIEIEIKLIQIGHCVDLWPGLVIGNSSQESKTTNSRKHPTESPQLQ